MILSINSNLTLRKAISSSTAEIPIILILSVDPRNLRLKAFSLLAPVSPVAKRVLAMARLSCPADLLLLGLPSKRSSRKLLLRSKANLAATGLGRAALDIT